MTCSEIREALSAMADGERPPVEPAAMHAHLARCEGCTAYQRSLGVLASATAGLRAETPPDLAPRVMARLRRRRVGAQLALRWAIAAAAVTELAVALALAWSAQAAGQAAHESH